jgi:hypothetical protein
MTAADAIQSGLARIATLGCPALRHLDLDRARRLFAGNRGQEDERSDKDKDDDDQDCKPGHGVPLD